MHRHTPVRRPSDPLAAATAVALLPGCALEDTMKDLRPMTPGVTPSVASGIALPDTPDALADENGVEGLVRNVVEAAPRVPGPRVPAHHVVRQSMKAVVGSPNIASRSS